MAYVSSHEGATIDESVRLVQEFKGLQGYLYCDGNGSFVGRTLAVDEDAIAQAAATIVLNSLVNVSVIGQ